ncbi:MAG: phosphoribosylformylglycinamidine synthase [Defluviitaleaceae bacterium]|nr:phosphoribosylformylglycinamidine synthase [Defluviitaleaceae bacterium]
MNKRIYVEKTCDAAVARAVGEFRDYLGITAIAGLRILYRYDVAGLSEEEFAAALPYVFAAPGIDIVHLDAISVKDEYVFATQFLPGVYDQAANLAAFSCALFTENGVADDITVKTARVYIISGNLSDEDKAKIFRYHINQVDERVVDAFAPEDFAESKVSDMKVPMSTAATNYDGLGMSEDDKDFIRDFLMKHDGRDATHTELRILDTYWSDHCRHSTFLTEITELTVPDGPFKNMLEETYAEYIALRKSHYGESTERPVTLMDLATISAKAMVKRGELPDLEVSDEQNAASFFVTAIENGVEREWIVSFKNETHNHPTEIEPFGGAATCLGGGIRDPLSGRSAIMQGMRFTGAADPRAAFEDTIPGKLPQRKLTLLAADGFSSYGNQVGAATGIINEFYHPGYAAKRMEGGAVVSATRREYVRRDKPVPGDLILLIGGRTGRDGIGGAVGSSVEHTDKSSVLNSAEVQRGDPHLERGLIRLFKNPQATVMIKKSNDFGAGGVSVCIGELADGLLINLDKVPPKYAGMNGTELAISESQERMAVVISSADRDKFIDMATAENLECVVVAEVTDHNRMTMMWKGNKICDLPRELLDSSGVRRYTEVCLATDYTDKNTDKKPLNLKEAMFDLNNASQKGLHDKFDSTVGTGTVVMPYGGKNQLTPAQAMVAKLPAEGIDTCTMMAMGYDPYIAEQSPFHGAFTAVVESVARIVATGGSLGNMKLSFQEFFGSPMRDPKRWGTVFAAMLGAFRAMSHLGLAAVGGKDSMSGTYKGTDGELIDVPPTLVSFAVCTDKLKYVVSPEFKAAGNKVAILECKKDVNGLPDINKFISNVKKIRELVESGKALSVHAISAGGAAVSLALMAIGNSVGVSIKTDKDLYAVGYGGFIIELSEDVSGFEIIGETTKDKEIDLNGDKTHICAALEAWFTPLDGIHPSCYTCVTKCPCHSEDKVVIPAASAVKAFEKPDQRAPKVIIPTFPGSTGEEDMLSQFQSAGANAELFVVNNYSAGNINEVVTELAEKIKTADILALPAGDEGASGYAAAVLSRPLVAAAIKGLHDKRNGLILGIGAGFHVLIKLGLLDAEGVSLLDNACNTFVSRIVRTKVVANHSPWLAPHATGDIISMPVSCAAGRLVADEATLQKLAANGQIAAVYVNQDGDATMDARFNPSGSYWAIEALASADGRVLGKMANADRNAAGLYRNVPGNYDNSLFKAAVDYFK